jgi:hypothetical protein
MITKWTVLCLIFLYFLGTCEEPKCNRMNFLPMPVDLVCGEENVTVSDPCKIFYHVKIDEKNNDHVAELITFQMKKSFKCNIPNYILSPKLEANLIGFDLKVEV